MVLAVSHAMQEPALTAGEALDLERDGACHVPGVAQSIMPQLLAMLEGCDAGRAGHRLNGLEGLAALLGPGHGPGAFVARMAGQAMVPVRAVLFDKQAEANWSLGWHQDRTIVVRERRNVPGYGPWTVKQGLQHVEPPFPVIEAMLTLRLHIDAVDAANAPLLIVLGSHHAGRIPVGEIEDVVAQGKVHACLARPGDGWLYRTPIVHASGPVVVEEQAAPRRRRVLQVDYAGAPLPAALEWLGI